MTTGLLWWCFLVLVLVLRVVGAGGLAGEDAGLGALRGPLELGLELVFDEAVDVAEGELEDLLLLLLGLDELD